MEGISTALSPAMKIISIGKKIAPFLGAAHGFLGDPLADGRTWEGIPAFITDRVATNPKSLLHGHIGNPLTTTMMALTYYPQYPIFSGAGVALMGWIMETIGGKVDGSGTTGTASSLIGGIGSIMKRYGTSAALSAIIAAWLYLTPFNPTGGTQQTQATGYTGGHQNVSQGPGATNTVWQVRAAANIRDSTGPVDVYPT